MVSAFELKIPPKCFDSAQFVLSCSGAIRTNIFEPMGLTAEQVEQALNGFISKHPVGRVGEVSDTSPAIAYLANNDLASFITGQFITVDGGSMLVGP